MAKRSLVRLDLWCLSRSLGGRSESHGIASTHSSAAASSSKCRAPVHPDAVKRAVATLRDFQPLSRTTHCAHAAAWVDGHGRLIVVREDVGCHNALDKVIGACARQALDTSNGFCLVTSRCSFEMVQKTVVAGLPVLVAISAPTALAIRTARKVGLTLIVLGRDGQPVVYSEVEGMATDAPTQWVTDEEAAPSGPLVVSAAGEYVEAS